MQARKQLKVHSLLGLRGVENNESPRALYWQRLFEIPTIALALWIVVVWYLESRARLAPFHSKTLDYSIWLYFLTETCLLTYLVNNRVNYLRNNWMSVAIIVVGIPVLWGDLPYAGGLRSLRLLILLSLLVPLSSTVRKVLARNHLGATLAITALLVFISGYIIAGIEPGVRTPPDGVWWAWVTISGIGYGDIVPQTSEGRIFASILIAAGIALYAIVTANISVFLISRAEAQGEMEPLSLKDVEKRLMRIEKVLVSLEQKIDSANGSACDSPQ